MRHLSTFLLPIASIHCMTEREAQARTEMLDSRLYAIQDGAFWFTQSIYSYHCPLFGMPIVKSYREPFIVSCRLSQWRSPPFTASPSATSAYSSVDLFSAEPLFFWNFRYLVEFFLISLVFPFASSFLFAP